jgi:hypothetical protein
VVWSLERPARCMSSIGQPIRATTNHVKKEIQPTSSPSTKLQATWALPFTTPPRPTTGHRPPRDRQFAMASFRDTRSRALLLERIAAALPRLRRHPPPWLSLILSELHAPATILARPPSPTVPESSASATPSCRCLDRPHRRFDGLQLQTANPEP